MPSIDRAFLARRLRTANPDSPLESGGRIDRRGLKKLAALHPAQQRKVERAQGRGLELLRVSPDGADRISPEGDGS